MSAVEGATATAVAEHRARVAESQARPTITVSVPFTAVGGEHYRAGTYQIDNEQLAELELWQLRVEAQANARGWDKPAFDGPWPPFAVTES